MLAAIFDVDPLHNTKVLCNGSTSFFYGFNVFLAAKNQGIDTKIIKFEFIVTEL